MKSTQELEQQMAIIGEELAEMVVLDDAEITGLVADGHNAQDLLRQQREQHEKNRALMIQRDAVERARIEAKAREAAPAMQDLLKTYAGHKVDAAKAVEKASKALANLHNALDAFEEAQTNTARLSGQTRSLSKSAGVNNPNLLPIGSSELAGLAGSLMDAGRRSSYLHNGGNPSAQRADVKAA